jgi:hypothetical protein
MKKIISILILINIMASLNAQNNHPVNFLSFHKGIKKERLMNLHVKKHERSKKSESTFFDRSLKPRFSVDLLDGTGIHLFTISNIDFIPTINVGARIKAGIIITI